jgi:hypothetical protein
MAQYPRLSSRSIGWVEYRTVEHRPYRTVFGEYAGACSGGLLASGGLFDVRALSRRAMDGDDLTVCFTVSWMPLVISLWPMAEFAPCSIDFAD